LHPEQGWGCEGDEAVGYLEELNKEFGCKFTLFIPSNYHGKYPLSKHKDWVDFWKKKDWVELSAHGHYHQCEADDIGECEFWEMDSKLKAHDRISLCMDEWLGVNVKPAGWRNPGWIAHPEAIKVLGDYFDYAAIHKKHNDGIVWRCKTLEGADGIHETESIQLYGDTFMFQSHIAGKTNDNNWDEDNYNNFRNVLEFLSKSSKLKYVTLGELV
jgi:hypothetical protein